MLKSKVLAAVLAACVAGLPVLHGYADELSEKQAEYDRVQQQMRDMEAQREEARRAADAASSHMEEVVSELRQLQIPTVHCYAHTNLQARRHGQSLRSSHNRPASRSIQPCRCLPRQ